VALNPEVSYDALRPTVARLFDFLSAWLSESNPVDLSAMFALPNVHLVRFSQSVAAQH
jgi:hypothetical protein